jgi:hypothetical protein
MSESLKEILLFFVVVFCLCITVGTGIGLAWKITNLIVNY